MVNEPKRIDITDATAGAGAVIISRFGPGTGTILRRLSNYHNIWWGFVVEPENADANANGMWVLWEKRDTNNPDPSFSPANINTGDINMVIIACGAWAASNQTPFNFSSQLKSSRNFVANQELVLTVRVNGISAGVARIITTLCAGVAVK